MSSAFVPGRILRDASAAPLGKLGGYSDRPGEVGPPLWSSAIGGGEGRRGDDEGETGVTMAAGDDEGETDGMSCRPPRVEVHAFNTCIDWSAYYPGELQLASRLLSHAGNARAKSGSDEPRSWTRLPPMSSCLASFPPTCNLQQ
jgi:hypothetical protein